MTQSTRRSVVASCGAAIAVGLAGCTASAREASESIDETYDADGITDVAVSTTNGNVQVRGESRETIALQGTKQVEGRRGLDEVVLESSRQGGELTLSVETDDGLLPTNIVASHTVDLDLVVPESLSGVAAETVNGEVDVRGVGGAVSASNTNGDVFVRGDPERVVADNTNGTIDLELTALRGDVDVETTNGDVGLQLPASADAVVAVDATNGDVTVEHFAGGGLDTSGDVETTLGDGTHRIEIDATNGDVTVTGRS